MPAIHVPETEANTIMRTIYYAIGHNIASMATRQISHALFINIQNYLRNQGHNHVVTDDYSAPQGYVLLVHH